MNAQSFAPNFSKTKSIAASSASASATLDATDVQSTTTQSEATGFNVMRVVNVGPNTAFVRWGVGAQTALATDMPILAGTAELFSKGNDTDTVAAICAAGQTATLYLTCGEGQ